MPSSVFPSASSDMLWSVLLLYVAGFEHSLRYAVCLFVHLLHMAFALKLLWTCLCHNPQEISFCALELRRIGHLRRHLSVDANRLDRLQRVQDNVRPVLCRRGRDHAKPLLRTLHGLPIRARIEYKISTLCYRSRDSSAPIYLSDLSARLPASCVPETLIQSGSTRQTQQVGKACFFHWPGLPSPKLYAVLQVFPPSNPVWKCSSW